MGLEEFKSKYESVARIDRKEKNTSLVEMNRAVKNVNAYNEEKQLASEYLLNLLASRINSVWHSSLLT